MNQFLSNECNICFENKLYKTNLFHKLETSSKKFNLATCYNCEHTLIQEPPSLEEIKKYYELIFWNKRSTKKKLPTDWIKLLKYSPNNEERFSRAQKQFKYLKNYIKINKNSKIIDIGSGFSPILYLFYKNSYKNIYSLDPDNDVCKYLDKYCVKTFNIILEDLHKNTDLKFDLVILSHTLEHIHYPNNFIDYIKKNMKKDSYLFIDVPYKDHLEPHNSNLHLNFFSTKSLSKLILNHRMNIINIEKENFNFFEKIVLKFLYFIYGKFFWKTKIVYTQQGKLFVFSYKIWKIIKHMFNLRINIFISRRNLKIIAKKN